MDIQNLFKIQENKNANIILENSLSDYKISARKYLLLHVKLSSIAEESKCFKFWKGDIPNVSIDKVLSSYTEALSLILTIGIDKGYSNIEKIQLKPDDHCLSDQFLNLFVDLNDLIISPSQDHYVTLFEDFLSLGISLGFSENKIKEKFINTFS